MDINELIATARPFVERREYRQAIEMMEGRLRELPTTDFHVILGRDLFHLTDSLAQWLDKFYHAASEQIAVRAMYCETNGFPINPDLWFIDAFAFEKQEGLDDLDWLSDWDFDLPDSSFVMTGFEDLQQAYKKKRQRPHEKDRPPGVEDASNLAEILIVLHVQALFDRAYIRLSEMKSSCASIPILSTAHDWDMIAVAGKLD